MPHQCVRCGKIYDSTAPEILNGCSCGSHFFFFFKQEDIHEVEQETEKLTQNDREEIEEDIKDIIGPGIDESKPVILNFESIRIKKPGKFEIDLVSLFKRKPLIYKIDEGKYIIDIASTFQLKHGEHGSAKKGQQNNSESDLDELGKIDSAEEETEKTGETSTSIT